MQLQVAHVANNKGSRNPTISNEELEKNWSAAQEGLKKGEIKNEYST